VAQLLAAKKASGKTYDQLAKALGLCNIYLCRTVVSLAGSTQEGNGSETGHTRAGTHRESARSLEVMRACLMRSYDPAVLQEPHIYRMTEVCAHYGESILDIMHEQLGDDNMSAIDFKLTVEKIKGDKGEDRLLMTWNGKFLPHIEQTA
jgi:cyanate lyase